MSSKWAAKATASTYIYLKEPGPDTHDGRQPVSWNIIPDNWKQYRWDAIDVLYVDPFPVQPDSSFDIGTVDGGDLNIRFKWVVANARAKNSNIRIICMQTSDPKDGLDWTSLTKHDQVAKYASTMAEYMKRSQLTVLTADGGARVSGRIDGFDLDYEYGTPPSNTKDILVAIRSQFTAVDPNPPLYLSITPAWIVDNDPISTVPAGTLDFVNMQRYDGGSGTTGKEYLEAIPGLKPSQLIYGIDAERPWVSVPRYDATLPIGNGGTLDDVFQTADTESDGGYGGMFIWRLNSNNDYFENMIQVTIYNRMHGGQLQKTPDLDMVKLGWITLGGKKGKPGNTVPTPPWNTFDWKIQPSQHANGV